MANLVPISEANREGGVGGDRPLVTSITPDQAKICLHPQLDPSLTGTNTATSGSSPETTAYPNNAEQILYRQDAADTVNRCHPPCDSAYQPLSGSDPVSVQEPERSRASGQSEACLLQHFDSQEPGDDGASVVRPDCPIVPNKTEVALDKHLEDAQATKARPFKPLSPQLHSVPLTKIRGEHKMAKNLRLKSGMRLLDKAVGLVNATGLMLLACLEPMHVVGKEENGYFCVAGLQTRRLLEQGLKAHVLAEDVQVPVLLHTRLGKKELRSLICFDLLVAPALFSLHFRDRKSLGEAWNNFREDETFQGILSSTGRPALARLLKCDRRTVKKKVNQ